MSTQSTLGDGARVGIDIGRVIITAVSESGTEDTSFISGSEEHAMRTPPVEDAFRVITEIATRARGNVWLVSKAGPRVEALTRRWLVEWRFFETTHVPLANVVFCRERKDKAIHAKRLALTHFIDDRVDVLEHLHGVAKNLYLFGHQRAGTQVPQWATHVRTWLELEHALLRH